ncbi:MAG: HemK2/MTQ2 family protein methyltransferase [Promethearchaeota archaeon]
MLARSQYPRFVRWVLELLHRRIRLNRVITMDGLQIQICPQVFNPVTGRTTHFFIQHMQIKSGSRVLELGTGSGAIAAAAAQISPSVTATDISPYAVKCAKATLRLNGVEEYVRVLQGDLFAPVEGETFDIILFNPPYLRVDATSWIARAWCAGSNFELLSRFLKGARQMLANNGQIQILLSSATSILYIISIMKQTGYRIRILGKGRILGLLEQVFLFQLV